MKIKTDFVTNSSSVGFIIEAPHKLTPKDLGIEIDQFEKFEVFRNVETLISYCQEEPCDWIDLAVGTPRKYYHLWDESFEMMKGAIEKGRWAIYAYLDRNDWDRLEDFRRNIINAGATIMHTEHE